MHSYSLKGCRHLWCNWSATTCLLAWGERPERGRETKDGERGGGPCDGERKEAREGGKKEEKIKTGGTGKGEKNRGTGARLSPAVCLCCQNLFRNNFIRIRKHGGLCCFFPVCVSVFAVLVWRGRWTHSTHTQMHTNNERWFTFAAKASLLNVCVGGKPERASATKSHIYAKNAKQQLTGKKKGSSLYR